MIRWRRDLSFAGSFALRSLADSPTVTGLKQHARRYHNAAWLGRLGAEPPLTDLITWCWKCGPAPHWN